MAGILAVLITVGFFGVIFVLTLKAAPPDNRDVLNVVLGVLGSGFSTMLGYFYGSSKGRDAKAAVPPAGEPPAGS